MIRVYDIPADEKTKTISRYGATYKLTNITKTETHKVYTYQAPGMETMVVVPGFLQQWKEADAIVSKIGKGKGFTAYTQLIKMKIDKNARVEDIFTDDGKEEKAFFADYKDIELEIEFDGSGISLMRLFTIKKHNIFGTNILVELQEGDE